MEQKNEMQQGDPAESADPKTRSAAEMQEDNAIGAKENEQGQASFSTASTTGGGSNFGQGSSHLGAGSYRQGDRSGPGSNYSNEAEGLGRSATGTSNEGSSSPTAGAARSGSSTDAIYTSADNRPDHTGSVEHEREGDKKETQEEGDRRDTGLEQDTGLSRGSANEGSGRPRSGSWSQSSTEKE